MQRIASEEVNILKANKSKFEIQCTKIYFNSYVREKKILPAFSQANKLSNCKLLFQFLNQSLNFYFN